jgi:predicted RNA binding protein YcfA (HicA-like mRNA interferase family)
MKYRDLIKLIEHDGTSTRPQAATSSTSTPQNPVAGKPGKDVPEGTLKSILRQAGLK